MAWRLGDSMGVLLRHGSKVMVETACCYAWMLGDGGMGMFLWHGSKVTVVRECCYGMEVR
jgi:hypothetical protein